MEYTPKQLDKIKSCSVQIFDLLRETTPLLFDERRHFNKLLELPDISDTDKSILTNAMAKRTDLLNSIKSVISSVVNT